MTNETPGTFTLPDPRPRVGSFVLLVVAAMALPPNTAAMSVVLGYVVVLFLGARRPARELFAHARRVVPFVAIIMVLNGVLVPGAAAVTVAGRGVLSREGLAMGAFFSVRLCVLYLATAVLVATTPPEAFAAAVFAFVRPLAPRPARRAAFYGFVSMSFIPLFADEARRVRTAQSFRGGALSGGLFERARGVRLLLVPLVISAIRRSEQLAMVTELRGLKDRLGDSLVIAGPRAVDAALPLVTLAVVAAAALGIR